MLGNLFADQELLLLGFSVDILSNAGGTAAVAEQHALAAPATVDLLRR